MIHVLRWSVEHIHVTLTSLAALLGMLLGTAGFVMSLMNYLRDKPRIVVTLKWDMTNSVTKEMMGLVKVTNVGRRPIFISIVALELPKGLLHSHLVLNESIPGKKLSEGDAPAGFMVSYRDLEQYSRVWRKIRAYAEDSANGKYRSRKLPKEPIPSWVRR